MNELVHSVHIAAVEIIIKKNHDIWRDFLSCLVFTHSELGKSIQLLCFAGNRSILFLFWKLHRSDPISKSFRLIEFIHFAVGIEFHMVWGLSNSLLDSQCRLNWLRDLAKEAYRKAFVKPPTLYHTSPNTISCWGPQMKEILVSRTCSESFVRSSIKRCENETTSMCDIVCQFDE